MKRLLLVVAVLAATFAQEASALGAACSWGFNQAYSTGSGYRCLSNGKVKNIGSVRQVCLYGYSAQPLNLLGMRPGSAYACQKLVM